MDIKRPVSTKYLDKHALLIHSKLYLYIIYYTQIYNTYIYV